MKYKAAKGTFDITPKILKEEDLWKKTNLWKFLEKILKETSELYGFQEIRTPIFEATDLFIRTVGDSSDIINKEMYTFLDKAHRSLSLRPEGTAPIIRAFIENHLQQHGSYHKLYYLGPYFRYDRPQSGRYRQFHQFGIEAIGREDPFQDVEVIELCMQLYQRLGLRQLKLQINSVGCTDTRQKYSQAFIKYLTPYFENLSTDSQNRFHKNPLRILDSKDLKDRKLLENAPSILDYLSDSSKKHFEKVCDLLSKLNIPFQINPSLVRGLDYYNETVFEIMSNALGAQNSIGAGGRYDGLMKNLGGPDLPSIGFATGLERVLQTMLNQNCSFGEEAPPFIFIIILDQSYAELAFMWLSELRRLNIRAEISLKPKKMQKSLQEASQSLAQYALILGEEEFQKKHAQIKNMTTRESHLIAFDTLFSYIQKLSLSST